MRVVAMSLQMEIIVFLQEDYTMMDPPFLHLRHTSRARAHGVHHWTLKVWVGELPIYGPSHTLFSQRSCLGTRIHGHNISAMATSGPSYFRKKSTPHTGEPNSLYHDGSLITCVALQGQVLSQSLPHTKTQYRISFWREKMSFQTHKQKSPGQWHQGTTEEEPPMSCHFNRKRLFRLGI